jgi:hypothetical protein
MDMSLSPVPRSLFAVLALAFLMICTAALAAPLIDARLTVALIQFNGQYEISGPANAAKPGDILEYSARYNNRGDAAADALAPTMPIPVGSEYVPAGSAPKPTHASLDGVTWAPIPLHRREQGTDGKPHDVEVPLSEYRALRWSVGRLAPGSEAVVRARVRISQATAVAGR